MVIVKAGEDETRHLFNRSKKIERDRLYYLRSLSEYSKELRKTKRKSFRRFTEEIDDLLVAARLKKALGQGSAMVCPEHI